jgi:hypothetical protein
VLIEATPVEGVVTAPLSKYRLSNVRICRAHALTPQDRSAVVRYVTDRIGSLYDSRNVFDLMRYLLPLPVPTPFRRRALALGPSGIDLCGPQIRSWVAFCFPDLPADSPAAH